MTERIEILLDSSQETLTYGEVARRMGTHPRAVGSCMRALARLGRNDLCARVVFSGRQA
jgi:alkylated DNA nucleotide flippase Atl1